MPGDVNDPQRRNQQRHDGEQQRGRPGVEGEALVDAFNVVVAALCGFATLELSTAPAATGEDWAAACRA